jgi:hypothetical protein
VQAQRDQEQRDALREAELAKQQQDMMTSHLKQAVGGWRNIQMGRTWRSGRSQAARKRQSDSLAMHGILCWVKSKLSVTLHTWLAARREKIYGSHVAQTAVRQWRYHGLDDALFSWRQLSERAYGSKRRILSASPAVDPLDVAFEQQYQAQATSSVELPSSLSQSGNSDSQSGTGALRIVRTRTAKDNGKPCVFFILEVAGEDGNDSFQVPRRYRDFDHLDKILREKYSRLSAVLPSLPPKKTFGALDPHFISSRKRSLEQYVLDLMEIPEIDFSQELQAFLSRDLSQWHDMIEN